MLRVGGVGEVGKVGGVGGWERWEGWEGLESQYDWFGQKPFNESLVQSQTNHAGRSLSKVYRE